MKIIEKENMKLIYPDEGCTLLWQGSWVSWIAVPLADDIDAVTANCAEYTFEEKEVIKEQERLKELEEKEGIEE